jgi:ABC-type branched-subunit amino acid transport system ATPase component
MALAEYQDAPAAALSYGQQKLLSIACCMAASGAIRLLDDPFAGVNPMLAERVSELIRAIVQDKSSLYSWSTIWKWSAEQPTRFF